MAALRICLLTDGAPQPGEYDIAVAMGWQATAQLFAVRATRHAYRVDELAHERMGAWEADRIPAALSYDLPVDFLAASEAVAAALRDLRPEARVLTVPDGVDKDLFAPAPDAGEATGALRVLALADLPADAAARARALAGADVLVALDPARRPPPAVAEALCAGVACIVSPGAEELIEHDVSGLVAEPGDEGAAARWTDSLQRDRDRLARLRAGALERARAIPSAAEARAAWDAALAQLVAEEPPPAALWPQRLMGDAAAAAALWHAEHHRLAVALRRIENDEAYAAAKRVRAALRDNPRLGPVRRLARPLLRRGRRRLLGP